MIWHLRSLQCSIGLVKSTQEAQEQWGGSADHQRKGGGRRLVGHIAILSKKVKRDVLENLKIMVSLAILRSQYDLLIDMKQVQGPNKIQQVLVAAFSLFIGILLARAMGL